MINQRRKCYINDIPFNINGKQPNPIQYRPSVKELELKISFKSNDDSKSSVTV